MWNSWKVRRTAASEGARIRDDEEGLSTNRPSLLIHVSFPTITDAAVAGFIKSCHPNTLIIGIGEEECRCRRGGQGLLLLKLLNW